MVLTIGLMMLSPASAGAFPGRNGMIAFSAPDANSIEQIFLMNPDGSGLQQITYGKGAANPVWSADGMKIAYDASVNGESEVWVMKADGTGAYKVTGPGSMLPTWSPDGTKIAYYNGTDEHLWFMSADGMGTPTQLTFGGSFDWTPSWSPDGTRIAFSRDDHLAVLTVATLSVNVLLPATFSWQPCWSPDGSMIMFVGFGSVTSMGGDIDVVSANGGTLKLIQPGRFFLPDWSPDGTKIVASVYERSVYIMNADGSGVPTDLTPSMPNAEDPAFQPLPAVVIPEYPFGLALLAVFMVVAYGVIRRKT